MLALVAAPPTAELREVPNPQPRPGEALVEVRAFSLNRGEVKRLADMADGELTGWDVAGVVKQAAADGSGPRQGARVIGLMARGAWAQLANVPTDWIAELPDSVSFEQGATLPVAGITALETLDIGGNPLGRRVLITGASGGVGTFAVQLAKQAGAHVTALARRQEGLRELGADAVVDTIPDGAEYDTILDAVGGPVLGAAIGAVAPGGTVVSFASTVPEPVSYPTRALFGRAPGAKLVGFLVFRSVRDGAATLERLAKLVAAGRLAPQIDRVASWREAQTVIQDLLDGSVAGKAVLTID